MSSTDGILSDIQAGWLNTGQLGKYVSFLALWPNSPLIVRVTGRLAGVEHRVNDTVLILTHFMSGWDDETPVSVPPQSPVQLLHAEPKEEDL